MKIGAMELIVIFIVALLVIGPDKLPQYAKKFGAALREFRKASSDVTKEIRESVIDPRTVRRGEGPEKHRQEQAPGKKARRKG